VQSQMNMMDDAYSVSLYAHLGCVWIF